MKTLGILCVLSMGLTSTWATPLVFDIILDCDNTQTRTDHVTSGSSVSCAGGSGSVVVSGDTFTVSGIGTGGASAIGDPLPVAGFPGSGSDFSTTINSPGLSGREAWFVFHPFATAFAIPPRPGPDEPLPSFARVDYESLGASVDSLNGFLLGAVPFRFGVGIEWDIRADVGGNALNPPPGTRALATFINPLSAAGPGTFDVFRNCRSSLESSCQNPVTNFNVRTEVFLNTPEPASLCLLGFGLAAVWIGKMRLHRG